MTKPPPGSLMTRWCRLAEVGALISCPEMRLEPRASGESVVTGSGEIRVTSAGIFTYTLRGIPEDVPFLMKCLSRLRDNPYDGLMRFVLNVVDDQGLAINAGWTVPNIEVGRDGGEWTFTGEVEALVVIDDKAEEVGTENVFLLPPREHLGRRVLERFVRTKSADGSFTPQVELTILSTPLTITLDSVAETLTIAVTGSRAFPQTYTENWLGEPLRIMFGQLIFPRIVARKNPENTHVWIRPTRRWHHDSDWIALWNGPRALLDWKGFWRTFSALLTFIAAARDPDGHPNFEGNKITELYEEAIQAAHGSRWAWALTLASVAEGLVRMMVPRGTKRADANAAGIKSLSKHIDAWPGADPQLKQVAKDAVARTADTSAIQALRDLRDEGAVTKEQVAAWNRIRNQVMHGSLISRYSSEEEDRLLLDLAGLMHALTKRIVGLC